MNHPRSKQSRSSSDRPETQPSSVQAEADCHVIEVRLRDLKQLFDDLDPSPFRERDLSPDAAEYIFDSVTELPSRARYALVIHLDQPASPSEEGRAVGDAIRVHFGRQAQLPRL